MKRNLCSFYNEVEQWNNVSDSDLVRASSDGKKFIKRNYFDSVMCKFTPNSFKVDRILAFMTLHFNNLLS